MEFEMAESESGSSGIGRKVGSVMAESESGSSRIGRKVGPVWAESEFESLDIDVVRSVFFRNSPTNICIILPN